MPWEILTIWYVILGTFGIGFGWCYWQLKVLRRPKVRAHFTVEGKGPDPWWKVIAVFGAIAFLFNTMENKATDIKLSSIRIYQAQFDVFDTDSGQRLFAGVNTQSNVLRDGLPLGAGTVARPTPDNGIQLEMAWIDYMPVTVNIGSEGYESKEVEIASRFPGKTIRVDLKKKPTEPSVEQPQKTDLNKIPESLKNIRKTTSMGIR